VENPPKNAKEEPKKAEPELNFETEVPKVIKKVVVEDSPILAEPEDDFIPIEDLPTEKVELPSELLGKFEATKAETPAVPVVESIPANQRPRETTIIILLTIITTIIITGTTTHVPYNSSVRHNRMPTMRIILLSPNADL
jgi:hypothetical protein